MKKEKVLVTGGSGFIGSKLIPALIEKNFDVRVLARKTSKLDHLKSYAFEQVEGDILKPESLYEAVKDCDYIFHLAGAIMANHEKDYMSSNLMGTENLLKAVVHSKPPLKNLIFISSLAAGGPSETKETPRSEKLKDNPVSFYGMSKLAAENAIKPYFEKCPITIIRPPMVYGERDKATLILAKTAKNKLIPLVHGKDKRSKLYSVIHVDDLVEALCLLMKNEKSGDVFYVHGPQNISGEELMLGYAEALGKNPILFKISEKLLILIATLLTFIGKMTGYSFMLNLDKVKEIREDYWICNMEKIKLKMNFTPHVDFKTGVHKTVKWYKENNWL